MIMILPITDAFDVSIFPIPKMRTRLVKTVTLHLNIAPALENPEKLYNTARFSCLIGHFTVMDGSRG